MRSKLSWALIFVGVAILGAAAYFFAPAGEFAVLSQDLDGFDVRSNEVCEARFPLKNRTGHPIPILGQGFC